MKKISFLVFLFSFFIIPNGGVAQEIITSSDEQDVYISGQTEDIQQYVPGDLVTAGANIRIDEPVGQDMSAIGFMVQVFGDIGDDARLAGHYVTVASKIEDNLLVVGNQIIIRSGANIGGDFWAAGEDISLNAPVSGDIRLHGKDVFINSRISGNAMISAKNISFGESGFIGGNLEYSAPRENISQSKVEGSMHYEKMYGVSSSGKTYLEKRLLSLWSPACLLFLISILVVGCLFLFLFRNYWIEFCKITKKTPFVSLGVGFLLFISFPVAAFLLALSVLGLPLSLLTMLVYFILLIVAGIISGLTIGCFFFPVEKKKEFWHIYASYTLGVLLLFLLFIIPFFGPILVLLLFFTSMGTLGRCHKQLFLALRKAGKV